MSVAARTVDGGSLVDQALRRVRAHIRTNDMKVGDTLPGEGWFADELGVSRAVMREAFGALAALRVIDVGNGRRARVGAIDGSVMGASIDHAVATAQISVAQVWDVRRTLELRTAELAAQHRTSGDADEIARAADRDLDNAFLLQLPNGHIIAAFRNHDEAGGKPTFYRITVCVSTDGGQSWSFLSQVNQRAATATNNGLWVSA